MCVTTDPSMRSYSTSVRRDRAVLQLSTEFWFMLMLEKPNCE